MIKETGIRREMGVKRERRRNECGVVKLPGSQVETWDQSVSSRSTSHRPEREQIETYDR